MHPDQVCCPADQFQVRGGDVGHGIADQPAQARHDCRRMNVEEHLQRDKLTGRRDHNLTMNLTLGNLFGKSLARKRKL